MTSQKPRLWSSMGSLPNSSSSSSSLRSKDLSSHASHSVGRGLAKLAVDVVGMSNGAKFQTETGKKYVTLSSELGEEEYDRLCSTAGLCLMTINYCQRRLSQLAEASTWENIRKLSKDPTSPSTPMQVLQSQSPVAAENFKKLKGIINHDYLVLEIQPGDSSLPIFYIVAEKQSGEKPGIHINYLSLEKKDEMLHDGVLHYSVDCRKKQIQLKILIDILKEGDPHYSLRNANCWDYATSAAKRLLKECAHVSGNSPEERARLESEHENLEAHLASRHICSTLKMLFVEFPQSLLSS